MKRIAIIGTGVAGMACGYFLRHHYDVTYYEKQTRLGGHTNTVFVDEGPQQIPVDTGFIVYNEITYPNLIRFFAELNIPTKPTLMSFSVQHIPSGLEYCGSGLNGLFAQRRNVVSPKFWKMLADINRFNKECSEVLTDKRFESYSVEGYAIEKKYGADMLHKYLIPMSSAIWSTEPGRMLKFPLVTLVRFFKNHGFLGLHGQYQWRTVQGGSRVYRDKVMELFKNQTHVGAPVLRVIRENGAVFVYDARPCREEYDSVILACHADEALTILGENAVPQEQSLLSTFRYQRNHALLHTDESVMPKTQLTWSAWNYRMDERDGKEIPSTVYSMNKLQQVSDKKEYFVSINDPGLVDKRKVLWETHYEHPIFDLHALQAQRELPQLNQNGKVFFCGSYFRYGFHEDAFTSGLQVVKAMTGQTYGYSV